MKTVLAKSYKVQALFARYSMPQGQSDILALLRKIDDFVDYQLDKDEMVRSMKPGYFLMDDKTLIRWTVDNINIIIFYEGDPNNVMIDITEELDSWLRDDPRYEEHLVLMKNMLCDFAQNAKLVPVDLEEDDPAVQARRTNLNNIFGPPNHLKGDTKYMAVVAFQGMGCDPFVYTSKTAT